MSIDPHDAITRQQKSNAGVSIFSCPVLNSVKQSLLLALEGGLHSNEDINNLVVQICYRAADLAYLLDMEEKALSDYSEALRQEPDELSDLD